MTIHLTVALHNVVKPTRPKVKPVEHPGLPYVGLEHVEAHTTRLLGTVPAHTMKSAGVHFQPGDVLYSRLRPYLNKVMLADFEGICSAEFIVLPANDCISGPFLKWLLNSLDFVQFANSLNAGDRPRVDFGQIGPYEFLLPSLDTQKRIVDEIETQLARLDEAVASLRRARTRLKRYRVSVLKSACEGRLVPTESELARHEGRDYEPASVLLDRIKAGREASARGKRRKSKKTPPLDASNLPDLPEGWIWTTLSELLDMSLSNGRSVPTADVGFPVLRLTALTNGFIDLSERKTGAWTQDEASRFLVAGGDFLVSRGNGSLKLVGRGGLVPDNPDQVAFPDTLIRVRANASAIAPKFLSSVWNSGIVRHQIESFARTTAGIYKVNQNDLSNVWLPLPPHVEQERIVVEVERRFSILDQLESTVDTNLRRAEALRQSILRKAFSGRLAP